MESDYDSLFIAGNLSLLAFVLKSRSLNLNSFKLNLRLIMNLITIADNEFDYNGVAKVV